MTEARLSDTVRKPFFRLTPTSEISGDLHAHVFQSKVTLNLLHAAFYFCLLFFSKLCIIILILLMKD